MSITQVASVSDFLDYLAAGNEALAALVLVSTASVAWFFQRYVGMLVWDYQRRKKACELALAIRTEIHDSITDYKNVFTPETHKQTIAIIDELEQTGKTRPLLVPKERGNFIFDVIKGDITCLPRSTIEPIVAFYTSEELFGSLYELIASQAFADSGYRAMRITVTETYEAAAVCIKTGRRAVKEIDKHLEDDRERNRLTIIINALIALLVSGLSATSGSGKSKLGELQVALMMVPSSRPDVDTSHTVRQPICIRYG